MKLNEKVVCISEIEDYNNIIKNIPIINEVYTIRDFKQTHYGPSITLNEIYNPEVFMQEIGGLAEPRFHAKRFRPLDEILEIEKNKEVVVNYN